MYINPQRNSITSKVSILRPGIGFKEAVLRDFGNFLFHESNVKGEYDFVYITGKPNKSSVFLNYFMTLCRFPLLHEVRPFYSNCWRDLFGTLKKNYKALQGTVKGENMFLHKHA